MTEEQADERDSRWAYSSAIGDILGERHGVRIILIVGTHGPIRFSNIADQMPVDNPEGISNRLTELCGAGLAVRTPYDESPSRVEYSLTARGEELYSKLDSDFLGVFVGKYAIPIVYGLGEHGPIRYMEIQQALDTSSTSTVSDHLGELASAGVVDRKSYDEIPPRVEYSLTERGMQLFQTIQGLSET